jgi:hypothetical protein
MGTLTLMFLPFLRLTVGLRRFFAALPLVLLLLTALPSAALAYSRAPLSQPAPSSNVMQAVDAPKVEGALDLPELPRGFDSRDAGWLEVSFPSSLAHWAEPLIAEANLFRANAQASLGRDVLSKVRVRLAEDPQEMATLAPLNAPYPKYAVGVAYSSAALILLTAEPIYPNADHDLKAVLRHELAHVALHDAVHGQHVPLWFNEGFAIHLARENSFGRMRALWTATVSGSLIELRELDRRFPKDIVGVPLAYAQAADVVRFLFRQQDAERFALLLQRVGRGQAFDRALYDAYGVDLYSLEQNWRLDVEDRYTLWPILLSGSLLWAGATVLIVYAWKRKRKRAKAILHRWANEEALEDERALLRKAQAAAAAAALAATEAAARVSVSEAPPAENQEAEAGAAGSERVALVPRDVLVPKVEHDGNWHTLH